MPTVHLTVQDFTRSSVRVAERKSLLKSRRLTIKNSCAWNVTRNRGFSNRIRRGIREGDDRRSAMKKDRLEWIISGLNQYQLTEREDQLIKLAEQDFNQRNMLSEQLEEKIENLYKEKSKLIPNKNYFSPKAKPKAKPKFKKMHGRPIP
jgi:DNA repair ATPase RecN